MAHGEGKAVAVFSPSWQGNPGDRSPKIGERKKLQFAKHQLGIWNLKRGTQIVNS